jgi:hypothetical protein
MADSGDTPVTAQGAVTVTLSDSSTITIANGQSSGTYVKTVTADEDVYDESGSTVSLTLSSASGGNLEHISLDANAAVTTITDTIDTTTVQLTVDQNSISESASGSTLVYTATVTNAAQSIVTIILSNTLTISINSGDTSGTVTYSVPANEDPYTETESISVTISSATGGTFENLAVDNTAAVTNINDTPDQVEVRLSAPSNHVASSGQLTYTARIYDSSDVLVTAQTDVTVTLGGGATITINTGWNTGTVGVTVAAGTITESIASSTGGNFEILTSDTSVVQTVVV